jgi:hypothetical protein
MYSSLGTVAGTRYSTTQHHSVRTEYGLLRTYVGVPFGLARAFNFHGAAIILVPSDLWTQHLILPLSQLKKIESGREKGKEEGT